MRGRCSFFKQMQCFIPHSKKEKVNKHRNLDVSCMFSQDNSANHQGCSGATLLRAENLNRSRPQQLRQPGVRVHAHTLTFTHATYTNMATKYNWIKFRNMFCAALPKTNSCVVLVSSMHSC